MTIYTFISPFKRNITSIFMRESFTYVSNPNAVSCTNCIYYVPRDYPFTPNVGRCRRFGEQDPETKEVTYDFSDICRSEEHKCGKEGKHHVKF